MLPSTSSTEAKMQRSLHQQLFEAYDSVRKSNENADQESIPASNGNEMVNNIVSPVPQVQVLDVNNASHLGMASKIAPSLQGGSTSLIPTSRQSSAEAQAAYHHGVHRSTLMVWDQIGNLTNEVSHSVIVKQAELLNVLAKKDNRIRKHQNDKQVDDDDKSHRSNKRQKSSVDGGVISSSSTSDDVNEHEDISCDDTATTAVSSLSSSEQDDVLTRQVERMIRMTNYVAEMERIHSLLRYEMEALTTEEGRDH